MIFTIKKHGLAVLCAVLLGVFMAMNRQQNFKNIPKTFRERRLLSFFSHKIYSVTRSARIVTGAPKIFNRPMVAKNFSDDSVKRTEPTNLCKAIGNTNCR